MKMTNKKMKTTKKKGSQNAQEVIARHLLRPTKRAIFEDCARFLKSKTPCKVLDVGSGIGLISNTAREIGNIIRCCDIEKKTVFGGLRVDMCDLNDATLPYPGGSFDIVLLTEVIEHVENPWKLVRECSRVLARGGTLYLTTPHLLSIFQRIHFLTTSIFFTHPKNPRTGDHITHMDEHFLREAFTRAGLRVIQVRYLNARIPFTSIPLPNTSWLGQTIVMLGEKQQ